MPNISFYADSTDFRTIHNWLNDCDELAFIVPDGYQRWRAVNSVPKLVAGRACLWHVPSGPLPLLYAAPSVEIGQIRDPWSGWQELRPGADTNRPYFGAGHPGIIWLYVHPTSRFDSEGIGFSWFEWIGNHYRILGYGADVVTEKFWRALRRWVKKQTRRSLVRVPSMDLTLKCSRFCLRLLDSRLARTETKTLTLIERRTGGLLLTDAKDVALLRLTPGIVAPAESQR